MSELKSRVFIKNEKFEGVTAVIKKAPKTHTIWLHLVQGKFEKDSRKNRISLEAEHCYGLDGKFQALIEKKTDCLTLKQHGSYPVFRKSFLL